MPLGWLGQHCIDYSSRKRICTPKILWLSSGPDKADKRILCDECLFSGLQWIHESSTGRAQMNSSNRVRDEDQYGRDNLEEYMQAVVMVVARDGVSSFLIASMLVIDGVMDPKSI